MKLTKKKLKISGAWSATFKSFHPDHSVANCRILKRCVANVRGGGETHVVFHVFVTAIDPSIRQRLDRLRPGTRRFPQASSRRLDRRTSVIIVGNARTDALKEIYGRAMRVIWLNPESRSLWNTDDSKMRHYSPHCHQVDECGTLAQLERAVSRLLRATS
jgi:hypothetical protein